MKQTRRNNLCVASHKRTINERSSQINIKPVAENFISKGPKGSGVHHKYVVSNKSFKSLVPTSLQYMISCQMFVSTVCTGLSMNFGIDGKINLTN